MKNVICLFLGCLLLIFISCGEIYGFEEKEEEKSTPAELEDWIAEDTVYIEISPS